MFTQDLKEEMFPELKESEDERIVKELLTFFRESIHGGHILTNKEYDSWIAWLEKQKTSDKALQYLKENHSPSEVSDFQAAMNIAVAKAYDKGYNDGLKNQGEQKPVTDFSDIRTWKYIVDAVWTEKEGIGQYLDSPFTEEVAKKLQKRFGNIEQKPIDKIGPKFKIGDEIEAANEESLTITKIDDKGYWSEDLFICSFDDAAKWELVEQKPAWGEEDEFELENVLCHLRNYLHKDSYIRYENWLKSLKDRIQPKPKWKPSDEQLEYLLTIKTLSPSPLLESLYVDLKKLREE